MYALAYYFNPCPLLISKTESKRFYLLQTKATEETSVDAGDLFADLKEKVREHCLITVQVFNPTGSWNTLKWLHLIHLRLGFQYM